MAVNLNIAQPEDLHPVAGIRIGVTEAGVRKANRKDVASFQIKANTTDPTIRVIEAIEGQLVTHMLQMPAKVADGCLVSDPEHDVLKMAVINRYQPDAPIAIAFIKNFGLKHGALASTVAHDCHNIIAVGVDDESMWAAVNALIDCKGGIAVATNHHVATMALPIAGLMATGSAHHVATQYTAIDKKAKLLGTTLHAPFMTLSFMGLLVIPALKLSDLGLFDGSEFKFTEVAVNE